jgi:hypothetical protein
MPFQAPIIVWLDDPRPITNRPGSTWAITFALAASTAGVRVYTVDAHRGNIMEKLNLRSAAEIVRFAMRNGLIE